MVCIGKIPFCAEIFQGSDGESTRRKVHKKHRFCVSFHGHCHAISRPLLTRHSQILIFTSRPAEAGLDLTLSVGVVSKPQMSHLETSNADSAQRKDVWNNNLEFLMSSAVCLLSADC